MILVRNLTYTHPGNVTALRNIDLNVEPGERIAIMGPNGSGKSTLARCLNGLLQPQAGELAVDGVTLSTENAFAIRELVGMVFQNPDDQLVTTSVESELAFGLENIGTPTAEMHSRVERALDLFGLQAYRNFPPHQLSGGEKQRVAVAAAMILRPRYLILDEPTSLLDPRGREDVRRIVDELHAEHDIATVHITQFPEEAARCERVVALDRGQVIIDAPPAEAFADGPRLRQIGLEVPYPSLVADYLRSSKGLDTGQHLTEASLAAALNSLVPTPHCAHTRPAAPVQGRAKISSENVVYTYDQGLPTARTGLDDVSIEIADHAIVALVGESGSGKTTFAQHLNALLKPDRGRILLDGRDIWADYPHVELRRQVGLVFQFPELQLFEETVALDVAFGPRNIGVEPAAIDDRVTAALEAVGLDPEQFGDRSPFSLSGGEKRRVAIAGVLAMGPDVLVLDEPTAGLDPASKRGLCERLSALNAEGTTVVLITHDMSLVADLAEFLVVLDQGRVLWHGAVADLFGDPAFADQSPIEPPPTVRLLRELARLGWPYPAGVITQHQVTEFLCTTIDHASQQLNRDATQ